MTSSTLCDDDILLLWDTLEEENDEDELEEEEEEEMRALMVTSYVLGAALNSYQGRKALRQRLYLRRDELLPDPMGETPWQRLYHSRSDRAFITTMGVDVTTFQLLLDRGFEAQWDTHTITRPDVHPEGKPRLMRRSLDAAGALGLVLHWLSSTMRELSLQQIFALIPTSVNRYLHAAINTLLATLDSMPEARIKWPTHDSEFEKYTDLIQVRHPRLMGAFGVVDGLNLPVQMSEDDDIENSTYNGWLHGHFVSNVFAFSPEGTIIFAAINAPGSWHDARIAQPLYEKLRDRTPEGYYLVSDTAFPRTAESIDDRIHAPLKEDERQQRIPAEGPERRRMLKEESELLSLRQAAEWGMREIQGSFGRLRIPLPIGDAALRYRLLKLVIRMHQVRVRLVGISHIRSTYVPIWQDGDDLLDVWYNWERMLFSEIRRKDRVARFYRISEEDL